MTEQGIRGGSDRKSSFLNRRVSAFIICLIISGAAWLLHELSKEYRVVIRVPVHYQNLPSGKLVAVDLPDSLSAEVEGSGFMILAYKWTNVIEPLALDASKARSMGKGDYAMTTNASADRIGGAIGHGLQVIRLIPDTIVLSFQGRSEKRVPVRPKVHASFAPMYRQGDSILVSPAYVLISGPEALISKISYVETEEKDFQNLDKNVNDNVKVVIPGSNTQVTAWPQQVNISIAVGKYTEGTVEIPIENVNEPADVLLKTFPDHVTISYQIPVEQFSSIKPGMFRAVVDYNKIKTGSNTAEVEIVRQPISIRNIKVKPEKVDIIIRKYNH
ncbi:MAG: hypothetical protein Fur0041_14130 [Bacteroidia bacterium]